MPKVIFVHSNATTTTIEAATGLTVMEAARDNNVPGIKAECGGECSCSTCHCYVDAPWAARLPPKRADEASLVEFAWEPKDTSRLACQIRLTDALDGLVLHIPERQL
ncbi:MAG: 2Fe-2S iron-sulfur cluster-binding protein [Betaproteobacteria bacterium]